MDKKELRHRIKILVLLEVHGYNSMLMTIQSLEGIAKGAGVPYRQVETIFNEESPNITKENSSISFSLPQ